MIFFFGVFRRPARTKLQDLAVNLHGDRAGVGHDHRLAGEQIDGAGSLL